MITAKTGTGSSWEQFVRLKAQAQVRNTGFTSKTVMKQPLQRVSNAQNGQRTASVQSYSMSATAKTYGNKSTVIETKPTKILGGTFDAWA